MMQRFTGLFQQISVYSAITITTELIWFYYGMFTNTHIWTRNGDSSSVHTRGIKVQIRPPQKATQEEMKLKFSAKLYLPV